MVKKLFFGLLILTLVAVPLLATACEEEVTPPAEEEEEEEEVEGDWWDEFGEPQSSGTITIPAASYMSNFDTYSFPGAEWNFFYEALFAPDWTLSRDTWPMNTMFTPDQYWVGNLVESWDVVDAQTVDLTLRQGIHFQNKPPVNGRELTADDVQAHYDRQMGIRDYANPDGTPNPAPMLAGWYLNYESVTATGTYTFQVKYKEPTGLAFTNLTDPAVFNMIEAPEWVALSDEERLDWHNAVGTGPWMLTDFVEGSSLTFSANPDYWGNDPRYTDNPVPYADTLEVLIMAEPSTRVSALRTGQIDIAGGNTTLTSQEKLAVSDTNPDIAFKGIPNGSQGVKMRLDEAPFSDPRVRQALNMSLNREAIAQSIYFGNAEIVPSGIICRSYAGYAYDYEDWSDELKAEYAYNPEGAMALLAEAAADGAFTPNAGGGFDTEVIYDSAASSEIYEILQYYFHEIGIELTITPMETAAYEAFFRSPEHHGLVSAGGGMTWNPKNSLENFWSQGADQGASMVDDPAYDALYDQYGAATNASEAMSICMEADKYIIEQHWLVTAGESYSAFNVCQPWIKGWSGESLFWGCQMWLAYIWIDASLK